MDATTKQKTLTGVLVALLVGSVFVGVVPTASAQPSFTPGVPPAVVDVRLTHTATFNGTTYDASVNNVTFPDTGVLRFNSTYDLTWTGIAAGTAGIGYVPNPASTSTTFVLVAPSGATVSNPRTAVEIGTSGLYNVTFPNVRLNETGVWDLMSGGVTIGEAFVEPANELTVTLSQSTFAFSTDVVSFTVVVTNATGPVPNVLLWDASGGIPGGSMTDQDGRYTFVGRLTQAGTFNINASRDYQTFFTLPDPSNPLPELIGTATYTVNSASLTVTGADTTIRTGFNENASWDIKYPNGSQVFASTSATNLNTGFYNANLTVTYPNGSVAWMNTSATGLTFTSAAGTCPVSTWNRDMDAAGDINAYFVDGTGNPNACANALSGLVWEWSPGGRFYFRPAATWGSGTYSFSLAVNTLGGSNPTAPEFTAAWSISTVAPADVNLKAFNGTVALTELSVPPATVPSGSAPSVYEYTITLLVQGTTVSEFPGTAPGDTFAAANVTITGDVLPVAASSISTTTTTTNGQVVISNVVPTDVGGAVNIAVQWKGRTTTISIPITRGAQSSADMTEIVVDQTSTFTVTLRDTFGNPVSTGQVFLIERTSTAGWDYMEGIGRAVINGTGAPGVGGNGQYTFTVRPTETGSLVAYGAIGTIEGGIDNRNFTYQLIRVVPAHDINVTLSRNSTMASVPTHVLINATAGTTNVLASSTSRVYFLNQTTYADLQANGTTALAGLTYPQTGTNDVTVSLDNFATAGLHVNATLPPGTYHVYVCSNFAANTGNACANAKHDNLNNTPIFTVHPWQITYTPSRVASSAQLQANTQVNVTVKDIDGNPANGTLSFAPNASTALATVPGTITITNGNGTFTVTGQAAGNVWTLFDPQGGASHAGLTSQPFRVVGPNITVSPAKVPVGRTTTVVITAKTLDGAGIADRVIRICGAPIGGNGTNPTNLYQWGYDVRGCTGNVTTNANGVATTGFLPLTAGTLYLYINGTLSETTIPVFAGLIIALNPATPAEGDNVVVKVSQVSSPDVGEADVQVTVDYVPPTGNKTTVVNVTTSTSGQVTIPNVQPGTYYVNASKTGLETATETFTIGGQLPTNETAQFEVSDLQVPANATVGSPVTVTAVVTNNGTGNGTATATLYVNGNATGSDTVTLGPGENETVSFTFTPPAAGTYTVQVRLDTGQEVAAEQITVNPPTTTPTPTTTSPTPTTTSPTPTTTSPTPTTTTRQTTTTTTPTTATPTTTTPTPGVPGFEVAALFAALGAALLVLRRRS